MARRLDLVLLVTAAPVFAVAAWPMAGYAVGAGVWLAQALFQQWLEARVRVSESPRQVVGLIAGGAMARAWFTAITILIAGLALGDDVGLSAILLVLALFTVYFATKTFERMIAPDGGSA